MDGLNSFCYLSLENTNFLRERMALVHKRLVMCLIQLMEYANALSAANLAAQMQTQVETRAAAAQVSHAVYNASTY